LLAPCRILLAVSGSGGVGGLVVVAG
jgi:hypothetical protein